ncbi:hypothetical protein [Telmatospirillum sp.]|uniref:hypothetical protein n=1 Tax=Telmatospirillum sp. TaxID=2079197 RepID=UPI0028519B00|nr:hypothetical protein [Telmatospirillum sp.]MDR3440550.1 hypothetical protein [Telmatospirillum sp.]
MNASLPPTLTSHLVSVIAEPDCGLLSRVTTVLARLDILPLQIYARLRQGGDDGSRLTDAGGTHLEVDLYLSADANDRRDRLVGLLQAMVGIESVVMSR